MHNILASLTFGAQAWLAPASLLLVAGLALAAWAYRSISGGWPLGAAALLKCVGLALLAICLTNPLWATSRAKPGANLFLLLADNSRSLQVQDRDDELRSLIADPAADWQVRLAQDFQVRRYLIDDQLRRSEDFSELDCAETSTRLGTALRTIARRSLPQPVAGALLFTDGRATDFTTLDDLPVELTDLPPIYPVLLGDHVPLRDLGVVNVVTNATSFEDAPVTVLTDVAASGFAGAEVVARLLDAEDNVLEERSQSVAAAQAQLRFRFQLKPQQPGVSFYRVEVADKAALENADRDPQEATEANNARQFVVDRGSQPLHVLYVSGRPNWEFKFLRRALESDEQIRLMGLIRIAKREPKFDWRGRTGESSNPLFRGFKQQDDETTERYDQPVLVRLNTLDAAELRDGFPTEASDLFRYDAIIIDDLEREFFTREQLVLLERFVAQRGGGLLMLGGQESFARGGYARTPVADLLPFYLDRPTRPTIAEPMRLALTREGWLAPWVRLRKTEAAERDRLDSMPDFKAVHRLANLKPGAQVLANVEDPQGQPFPALAVQRFGQGRVGALTIGDLWRWRLRQDPAEDDLGKAWRQMVRWLVADVPPRMNVQVADADEAAAGLLRLAVTVHNEEFQPLDAARVTLNVETPAGEQLTLPAEPSLASPGVYETTYLPRETGGYRVTATAVDGAGEKLGTAATGWTSDPAAVEFRDLAPNRELLEALARRTGGEVVTAAELPQLVRRLPQTQVPVVEASLAPVWHHPLVLVLALFCFVAEWGLRRWQGLP